MSQRSDVSQLLGGGLVKGKLLHLFIFLLQLSRVYFFNLLLGGKLFEAEDYLLLYICTVRGNKEFYSFWKIIKDTSCFKTPCSL